MKILSLRTVAVAAMLFASPVLFAQQDDLIDADRPGIADSGHAVRPGTFQLEAGIEQVSESGANARTVPLLLRYGLVDRLELRVESDTFSSSEGEHGIGPVAVGAKWQWLDGGEKDLLRDLGVIGSVTLPSGSGAFKQDKASLYLVAAADLALTDKLSLNPNAGFSRGHDQNGEARLSRVAAATLEYDVTDRIRPAVELARTAPEEGGDNGRTIVDVQFAWIAAPSVQLDVEAGRAVGGDSYEYVTAGVSHRF